MTNTQPSETSTFALILSAYLTCALWSGLDWSTEEETGNPIPLDENYDVDDVSPEAVAESAADLHDFLESNAEDLAGMDPEQIGHDFWLSRNHHGAGFWDRGLGERGDRLTSAAHVYGEVDLYVGDDGKLYV
jgi:hypothetical protein